MGSLSDIALNANFLNKQFTWMGDAFSALGYFLGGDFQKALAAGFMK